MLYLCIDLKLLIVDTRIKLQVQGLANSQIQSGAYALILRETDGQRRIPIIIGVAEAQSIAIALQHILTPRPLTHDLFATFSQAVGAKRKEIFIYKFEEGIYYSEMLFVKGEEEIRIDSRTSDAIAISLRMDCDIYTTPEIVEECGVVLGDHDKEEGENVDEEELTDFLDDMEPEDIDDPVMMSKWLSLLEDDDLADRLEEAVDEEKYENAKLYKDEIQRRKDAGEAGF